MHIGLVELVRGFTIIQDDFKFHGMSRCEIMDANVNFDNDKVLISMFIGSNQLSSSSNMFIDWNLKLLKLKKSGFAHIEYSKNII